MESKICTRGVWDSTIPGIEFDDNGVSNYAKMFDKLCEIYPQGKTGQKEWTDIVDKIKKDGKNKKYDCIIGVSGGTDSSYLLHIAKREYGLRPLAVNLDNGWSSDIAVNNIKIVTKALDIDLETYVINYEEVKSVLRSYIKASLPWIDSPTDIAIKSSLYKIAAREGIKYTLNGGDFRSEGKQPTEWTYSDAKQMIYLLKKFENKKRLHSFPYYRLVDLVYFGFIRGIKTYRPFYYIDYKKKAAQDFLEKEYGWVYYGGHHHENIFTKFAIAYWLPQKFNIDKRKITLSAQILSGEIEREKALELLKHPPYPLEDIQKDKTYVLKKLGITSEDFTKYLNSPNKYFSDYPSYFDLYQKYSKYGNKIFGHILPFKPTIFIEQDFRKSKS